MLRTIGRGITAAAVLGTLCWAYGQAFDRFARQTAQVGPNDGAVPVEELKRSATAQEATALAETCFGHGHWTTDPSRSWRYYSAARGYWIYAQDYQTGDKNQKVVLTPFALVWRSSDGKSLKSVLAKQATITLDRPYISEQGGGAQPVRVARAKIEGDVVIRDHKKTLQDTDDDLVFSLPELEFDDETMTVTSEYPLRLADRGVTMTGVGLDIKLVKGDPDEGSAQPQPGAKPEPKRSSATYGYKGVHSIVVRKDITITIEQSGGKSAIPVPVPNAGGPAKPGSPRGAKDDGPLILTAAGPMKLEPPSTRPPRAPGEPELPPEPTLADFQKTVKVRKGHPGRQDELDCDRLQLVLVPTKEGPRGAPTKLRAGALTAAWSVAGPTSWLAGSASLPGALAATTAVPAADDSGGSVGGNLALQRAEATGHAVWVRSFEQAFNSKGRYLLHEKSSDAAKPDRTFLRGDASEDLFIEKLEYADASRKSIKSVFTMHTADLSLLDSAHDGQPSEVVSRGPGRIEERPSLDAAPVRTVTWRDQLRSMPDGPVEGGRRIVLLTGQPRAIDPKQGDLAARKQIMLWLSPGEAKGPAKAAPGAVAAATAKGQGQEKAKAPADPFGGGLAGGNSFRVERMQALEDITFEGPGQSLKARKQLDLVMAEQAPAPAADAPQPGQAGAEAPKAAAAPAAADGGQKPKAGAADAAQPEKPEEPPWDVMADTVWAQARMSPGKADNKSVAKLDKAYLRGGVEVHQAAAKGKARGLDAHGAAIDLEAQRDGLMLLRLSGSEPGAKIAKVSAAADGTKATPAWAKVAYEDFLIEGAILSINQADELAYVKGPGRLTQFGGEAKPPAANILPTSHSLPSEAAPSRPRAVSAKPEPPKVLTWTDWMRFTGREQKDGALHPAKATFAGQVKGDLGDSAINADSVEAYFDRVIPFTRASGGGDPRGSKPEIVYLESEGKVALVHYTRDEATRKITEVIRVDGPIVRFDEAKDIFQVEGPGFVRHYQPPGARRDLAGGDSSAKKADPNAKGWELMRISFQEGMEGRVGGGMKSLQARKPAAGEKPEKRGPRKAEFYSEVDLIQANVPDTNHDVDPESPPPGYRRLNADLLVVESLAPPPEAGPQVKDWMLARAFGQARVRTIDTSIQGDQIRYDSLKETFHVYGGTGQDVIVAQQKTPGQPASHSQAAAIVYNLKTQRLQAIEPRGGDFIDPGSISRYTPESSGGHNRPAAPRVRPRFPAQGGRDRERAGFGDGGSRYSNGGMMGGNGNGGLGGFGS